MSWKKSCSFLLELAARRAEIDGQFTLALSDVHNPGAMFRFNERTVKELLRGEVDGCAVDSGDAFGREMQGKRQLLVLSSGEFEPADFGLT